jgi:hypothetical protein
MKTPTDVVERKDLAVLGDVLDKALPKINKDGKRLGFALIVFDFGKGGNQYISNGKRTDMIAALRELLGKWAADGSVHN